MNQESTQSQEIEMLKDRLTDLEKKYASLETSSSISRAVEKAFGERGFLKSNNFIRSGQETLTVGGNAYVPMQGVSVNAIGFAVYADGTGSDIGCVMANDSVILPNIVQLILSGIGTKTVYYVVFVNADKTL